MTKNVLCGKIGAHDSASQVGSKSTQPAIKPMNAVSLRYSSRTFSINSMEEGPTEGTTEARQKFSRLLSSFRARNNFKLNDFKDWSAVRPGFRVHNSQISCLQNTRNDFVPKDSFWLGLGRFNQDVAENVVTGLLPDLAERLTNAQPICLSTGETAQAHELWGMFNGLVEIPPYWLKQVVTEADCIAQGESVNREFLAFVAATGLPISEALDRVSTEIFLPDSLASRRPAIQQILLGITPPPFALVEADTFSNFEDFLSTLKQ